MAATHRPNYTVQVGGGPALQASCRPAGPPQRSGPRSDLCTCVHLPPQLLVPPAPPPPPPPQVLTAILQTANLPGPQIDNRDSGANVKASALVRMDENLTVFADVTGGCERILRCVPAGVC